MTDKQMNEAKKTLQQMRDRDPSLRKRTSPGQRSDPASGYAPESTRLTDAKPCPFCGVPAGDGSLDPLARRMEAARLTHKLLMRDVGRGASDEALEEMMLALGHLGKAIAAVRRRSSSVVFSDPRQQSEVTTAK